MLISELAEQLWFAACAVWRIEAKEAKWRGCRTGMVDVNLAPLDANKL
jgi:hypothetical protein